MKKHGWRGRKLLILTLGWLFFFGPSYWTVYGFFAAEGEVNSDDTIAVGIKESAAAGVESDGNEAVEVDSETESRKWAARLTQVVVKQENGLPVVKIVTTRKVRSTISYLSNPDRLLLKVQDTLLTWKPTTLSVQQPPLKRIRSAQHDDEVWVVLDLDESVKWIREAYPRGITLRLPARYARQYSASPLPQSAIPGRASRKPGRSAPVLPTTTAAASYQVVDITAENLGEKTRLTVTTDGQARYRVQRQRQGREFILKIYGAALAWRGKLAGLPLGVVRRLSARQRTEAGEPVVQIVVQLSHAIPYLVFKDQNQVLIEFNNPGILALPAGQRGNLTARVSIDLQNADLRAVLRALAQEAGFDLVLTPGLENVQGTQAQVTLSIDEQPFNTVLDFILRPRQMAYAVSGNTLRVGLASEFPVETQVFTLKNLEVKNSNIKDSIEAIFTEGAKGKVVLEPATNRIIISAIPSDMVRVRQVIQRMDVERRLVTRTFMLNYTPAKKLLPLIEPMLSSLGSVKENTSENALVVSDISGHVTQIARMIRSLDTKAQQVMIEARIVEVSCSNQQDLGVNWNAGSSDPTANPQINLSSSPDPAGTVGQITLGTVQGGVDLNATLSVLESKGKVNIISNPRIATLNNKSATLKASQNIPYTTSTVSNGVVSNVVNYLELPITLTVTPRITQKGRVMLNPMTLTVTTVVGEGTPPTTSTRSATTQMVVEDGETIAIGGMVRDEKITRESKVPLLGDIPLLGFLFRSNITTKNKVELVVFLTTYILE